MYIYIYSYLFKYIYIYIYILSWQETPNIVMGGSGKRTQYHENTHMRAHI